MHGLPGAAFSLPGHARPGRRAVRGGPKIHRSLAAEHYAHRRVFTMSVVKGLLDGCREIGCESGSLDLAGALKDFFAQPSPMERWLRGEKVFSRLSPLAWRTG